MTAISTSPLDPVGDLNPCDEAKRQMRGDELSEAPTFDHFSSQTSRLPVSFLARSHFVGAGAIKERFVFPSDLGLCDRPAVCLLFSFHIVF